VSIDGSNSYLREVGVPIDVPLVFSGQSGEKLDEKLRKGSSLHHMVLFNAI
jgi:hypothetical protein